MVAIEKVFEEARRLNLESVRYVSVVHGNKRKEHEYTAVHFFPVEAPRAEEFAGALKKLLASSEVTRRPQVTISDLDRWDVDLLCDESAGGFQLPDNTYFICSGWENQETMLPECVVAAERVCPDRNGRLDGNVAFEHRDPVNKLFALATTDSWPEEYFDIKPRNPLPDEGVAAATPWDGKETLSPGHVMLALGEEYHSPTRDENFIFVEFEGPPEAAIAAAVFKVSDLDESRVTDALRNISCVASADTYSVERREIPLWTSSPYLRFFFEGDRANPVRAAHDAPLTEKRLYHSRCYWRDLVAGRETANFHDVYQSNPDKFNGGIDQLIRCGRSPMENSDDARSLAGQLVRDVKGLRRGIKRNISELAVAESKVRGVERLLEQTREKEGRMGSFLTIIKETASGNEVAFTEETMDAFIAWIEDFAGRDVDDIFIFSDEEPFEICVTYSFRFGGYKCRSIVDGRLSRENYDDFISAIKRKGFVPAISFTEIQENDEYEPRCTDTEVDDMGEIWNDKDYPITIYTARMKEEFIKLFEGQRFDDDDDEGGEEEEEEEKNRPLKRKK